MIVERQTPSAVVFDLGGVLVDLGTAEGMYPLFDAQLPFDDMRNRWGRSAAVHAHESGAIDAATFAQQFIEEQQVELAPQEFLRRFLAWPRGPFPGAADLVSQVAARCPTSLLSNTSAVHWQRIEAEFDLVHRFERVFLSFEMRAMKPLAPIYEMTLAALQVPAANVLFLDDSPANVEGAKAVGINAHLVAGVDAAREVLASYRLV